MDKVKELFLSSLKASIRNEKLKEDTGFSDGQWQDFFELARIHHVLPMVFDSVRELPELQNRDFVQALKLNIRRSVFMHIQKTGEFFRIYNDLRSKGITPLVVKGTVCRSLYPNPDYRISSDEDLLIPSEQIPHCHRAMLDAGLGTTVADEKIHDTYEIPYRKTDSSLYIELHQSLFPPESDAYGDFNSFFEGVFERTASIKVQDTEILTLSPTDHLFYLLCHAFKHFLHSGFGLRQVCDIILFAERYSSEINWELIIGNVRRIKATYFAAAIFAIGRKYFGMDENILPEELCSVEVDESAMLMDLLSAGVFGSSSMSRKHSSNITLDAVAAEKQGKTAKNSLLLSLFPAAEKLESRYPYLKDRHYLVPIAWAQRIVTYGKEVHRQKDNSASEALKIGSERVELLRKYKIID